MDVRYPPPLPTEGGDDPAGPPPPPFVRERERRRRRRRWIVAAVVAGVVLLVGVPLLAVGGFLLVQDTTEESASGSNTGDPTVEEEAGPPDDGTADDGGGSQAPPPRPEPEVPEDERVEAPATEGLDAVDARIADLLRDIDASEGVMIAYQEAAGEAVTGAPDPEAPEAVLDELEAAARTALDDLADLRDRLTTTGGDGTASGDPDPDAAPTRAGAAADVRDAYVGHLDAWVEFLTAIEEDPSLLLGETTRFTIDINRTGDDFVRAVDELVATDVDPSLGRYAEAIVARGFSGPETPQV